MNQRLCIGIQHLTPAWEAMFNDLGLWFEEIDYNNTLLSSYSLIILNQKPDTNQTSFLYTYLQAGGALLELKNSLLFTEKTNIQRSFKKTVVDRSNHKAFRHVPFLDLYNTIEHHKSSKIFEGVIHFEKKGKGILGFLGLEIPTLLQSTKYKRKRFFAVDQSFPDEIVSSVSKQALADVLESTMAHLHFHRNLPFPKKWTSPTKENVFCFRIDSDFGDKPSIQKLYKLCSDKGIKATWFLHVQAHEKWLDVFRSFEQQEIALHGYKHGTTRSSAKAKTNIHRGKTILEHAGMNIDGFCAPYGIWNEALEKALTNFNFTYTSEFTFKYDGFPATITSNKDKLQIPIHPICTGSLNRRHYSDIQMKNYFDQVIEHKSNSFSPILFYHHPMQPGYEIIEHIFNVIKKQGLHNLTFTEYADFWLKRQENHFKANYDGKNLEVDSDRDMLLQVSYNHDEFYLVNSRKPSQVIQKMKNVTEPGEYLPTPKTIQKMRATDLRLFKTSFWDWKNRIRL